MGMYDQLLSLTQQGLDRNNQIAMTSAQQPTMADVFMDRFRQGGQDRMAAQKMQSDMAMNEAYKNVQMQKMKDDALNAHIARQSAFLKDAGGMQGVTPQTRSGWVAAGSKLGLPETMFPVQEFQKTDDNFIPMNAVPSSNRRSTEEDMGEFVPGQELPIGNTGYSPQLEYMRDMMDLKGQAVASKSASGGGKPQMFKDPLMRFLQESQAAEAAGVKLTEEQKRDREYLLRTVQSNIAAGLAGQGLLTAPRLSAPRGFGQGETPIATAQPQPMAQQQPQQPTTPVQQFNTVVDGIKEKKAAAVAPVLKKAGLTTPPVKAPPAPAPGNDDITMPPAHTLSPNGQEKIAKIRSAKDAAQMELQKIHRDIESLVEDEAFDRVAGPRRNQSFLGRAKQAGIGMANRSSAGSVLDPKAHEAAITMERIKQMGTLGALVNLKSAGGTLGQVTEQEGMRLEKSFAAIDWNQSPEKLRYVLRELADDISKTYKRIGQLASDQLKGLGASYEAHALGEVRGDGKGGEYKYTGGNFNDKKNWKKVK